MQQSTLARARRRNHRHHLSFIQNQVHVRQHVHLLLARAVPFPQSARLKHCSSEFSRLHHASRSTFVPGLQTGNLLLFADPCPCPCPVRVLPHPTSNHLNSQSFSYFLPETAYPYFHPKMCLSGTLVIACVSTPCGCVSLPRSTALHSSSLTARLIPLFEQPRHQT